MPRAAIVDDDADFLEFAGTALADIGWDVVSCSDSLQASEVIVRTQPDVALLDLRLENGHSGWQLCALLQADPRTAHIPLVVCSADRLSMRERARWLDDRGIGTLEKPFELDDLYATVEAAGARAASAASPPSTASSA